MDQSPSLPVTISELRQRLRLLRELFRARSNIGNKGPRIALLSPQNEESWSTGRPEFIEHGFHDALQDWRTVVEGVDVFWDIEEGPEITVKAFKFMNSPVWSRQLTIGAKVRKILDVSMVPLCIGTKLSRPSHDFHVSLSKLLLVQSILAPLRDKSVGDSSLKARKEEIMHRPTDIQAFPAMIHRQDLQSALSFILVSSSLEI